MDGLSYCMQPHGVVRKRLIASSLYRGILELQVTLLQVNSTQGHIVTSKQTAGPRVKVTWITSGIHISHTAKGRKNGVGVEGQRGQGSSSSAAKYIF